MIGATSRSLLCLGAVGAGMSAPAFADRPKIAPFIDLNQVVEEQLHGDGRDSVTYSEISAGVAAEFKTRRIVSTLSYRYALRIPEGGKAQKSSSHDGVARVRIELVKDLLSLDGGAIATHTRVDAGGAAPQFNSANAANLAQVYAVYASPSLAHSFGEADVAASYRYGYVVNEGSNAAPAGLPTVDRFESSTSQEANLSVGMKRSSLPFDWTVRSQYQTEQSTQLARHFETINGTLELIVPVSATIAAVASGGYEKSQTTQRSALLDANGLPVLTGKGGFVVDPASPRILTYDVSGFIGDGGVIWRPSHHTRLEVRAGYRYGGFTTNGIFEYQPSVRSGFTLLVFDRIDSFGRGVTDGLAAAPASIDTSTIDTSTSPYQNCLFGKQKGAGSCIGSTLGAASASTYRSQGANFIYSYQMRRTGLSFGAGYTRRTYIDDPAAPNSLDGVVDQSWYFQAALSRQLTQESGINFAFSGDLFKNGQVGTPDVMSAAFNTGYFRTFGRRLRAQALVGIEASKQDGIATDVSGRAQLGMRYQF